jgi:hypothetical protein
MAGAETLSITAPAVNVAASRAFQLLISQSCFPATHQSLLSRVCSNGRANTPTVAPVPRLTWSTSHRTKDASEVSRLVI